MKHSNQQNLLGGRLVFSSQLLDQYVQKKIDMPLLVLFNTKKLSLYYIIDETHYGKIPISNQQLVKNIKKFQEKTGQKIIQKKIIPISLICLLFLLLIILIILFRSLPCKN